MDGMYQVNSGILKLWKFNRPLTLRTQVRPSDFCLNFCPGDLSVFNILTSESHLGKPYK